MRAKVFIAGCALLVIVGVAVYHHSQRAVPAKPSEQASAANPPRPRLPAPRMPVTPPAAEPAAESTNLLGRLLNGGSRPSAEQLAAYLQKHHRSAESLLAAFHATGDPALLREAMEKHPDDPRVAFTAYYRAEPYDSKNPASPERRQWLEALAKAAPDNALPNYLAAFDSFRAGQTDQAVQELFAASQKTKFQDYSREFMQNAEEAYLAAGWSDVEAKGQACYTAPAWSLWDLSQTGPKLAELAGLYRQGGDEASAQAVEQISLNLSHSLTGLGPGIMWELNGIGIERSILRAMDPNSILASTGQTVQNRLDALNQRKAALRKLGKQSGELLPTLSDQDAARFFDRSKTFGEEAAVQWLIKTFGK